MKSLADYVNSRELDDEDPQFEALFTKVVELFSKLKESDDEEVELTKPTADELKRPEVYWFDVKIAVAGSNRRTQTNAVLDVFRGGNKQTFSGGAVVSYRIFGSNGRVLASDTVMTYMPYKKSGEITEFVCRPTNTSYTP